MQEYKEIYDKIQEKPIIPKKSYPLNQEKVKEYLENTEESIRPILKKLFDNTTHISYQTFKFILYNNFKELIRYCKIRNIGVISLYLESIDYDNIIQKSNFWVAQHFYQYLKKNKINIKLNIIYNSDDIKFLDDDELIVILDDCSYTGTQIYNTLKNDLNVNKKFNIYIIITFITNAAIKLLKSVNTTSNIIISKNNVIIKDFYQYLTDYEKNLTVLKMHFTNKYPIYFDHKLADSLSTYTSYYSGMVYNSTKIIPVITNCEHMNKTDDINLYTPKCPISPYKINSADYELYKDNIKIKSSSTPSIQLSFKTRSLDRPIKIKNIKVKRNNFLIHYLDYIDKIENKKLNYMYQNIKLKEIIEFIQSKPLEPKFNYDINKDKLKQYYKMLPPIFVPTIKKVIDNTIYISYPSYIKDLLLKIKTLNTYLKKNNITTIKLFIFQLDSTNRWVSQHLYHNLKDVNIIIINKQNQIKENDFVVYADDYILDNELIKRFFNIKKYYLPSYTLYFLTTYANNTILNKLKSKLKVSIPKLILSDNIISVYPLKKYLTKEENDVFVKYISYNLNEKYAIYGDHNMHNNVYIPIAIYSGLLFEPEYKSIFLYKLFPIMNNCNNTKFELYDIKCPIPMHLQNIKEDLSEISSNSMVNYDVSSSIFSKSLSSISNTNIRKNKKEKKEKKVKEVKEVKEEKKEKKVKEVKEVKEEKKEKKEKKVKEVREEKKEKKEKKVKEVREEKKEKKEKKVKEVKEEKKEKKVKEVREEKKEKKEKK